MLIALVAFLGVNVAPVVAMVNDVAVELSQENPKKAETEVKKEAACETSKKAEAKSGCATTCGTKAEAKKEAACETSTKPVAKKEGEKK